MKKVAFCFSKGSCGWLIHINELTLMSKSTCNELFYLFEGDECYYFLSIHNNNYGLEVFNNRGNLVGSIFIHTIIDHVEPKELVELLLRKLNCK